MSEPITCDAAAEFKTQQGIHGKLDSIDEPSIACEKMTSDDADVSAAPVHPTKDLDTTDPFAYLERDAYTSEIFKIEINNLPKRFGIAELKKRLAFLGLKPKKVKATESSRYAFVTFSCTEDRVAALSALNGHTWKGFTLSAKTANPAADPLMKKRKLASVGAQAGSAPAAKKEYFGGPLGEQALAEQMYDAVIPLWKMTYGEQLELKQKEMVKFLDSLGQQVQKCYRDAYVPRHLIKDDFKYSGRMGTIKQSPITNGYRNKCEFTIGRHPVTDDPVVGFRLSDYKSGSCAVMNALDGCKHISPRSLEVAKAFQIFIRQSSYEPFDPVTKKGNWRCLMVRTCRSGDIMADVMFVSAGLPQEAVQAAKDQLKEYFSSRMASTAKGEDAPNTLGELSSLYFQQERSDNDASPPDAELLLGKQFIIEDLSGKKFRVSPDSFLQVNTDAAEVLYDLVGSMCHLRQSTTVLDVCCGTGTIGLTLARTAKHVVGIEIVPQAVEDAKSNAVLNDVTNVEFICGKAEDVLPGVLLQHAHDGSSDVIAVVDPPRAGLHGSVLQAIRKSKALQRLVYVSCSPTNALPNFLDLLRPESRRMKGPAFRLVQAVPVDLFPHTKHCELVLLFERSAADTSGTSSIPVECPLGATEDIPVLEKQDRACHEQGKDEPITFCPELPVDSMAVDASLSCAIVNAEPATDVTVMNAPESSPSN